MKDRIENRMSHRMSDRDRQNFYFIMSLSEEEFEMFFLDQTDDEIQYAVELIQAARKELMTSEQELMDSPVEDLSAARAVLTRIMAL